MKGRSWIREQIVAEYLRGDSNYRELELRYGIGKSTLHRWVRAAGRQDKAEKRKYTLQKAEEQKPVETREPDEVIDLSESEAAAEIKRLKRELHKAELHAEVLSAMIEIAKEELGVDIRKKHGPKR